MAKTKYHFNPETLNYEKITLTFWGRVKQYTIHFLTSFMLAIGLFVAFALLFESPFQRNLRKENSRIIAQYKLLDKKLDEVEAVLEDLQQRDDNLYRVVFQADPIPYSIRKGEYGNTSRYDYLHELSSSDVVFNISKRAAEINRQIYVQSKSFDEIVSLAQNSEEMLMSIPAIQPVFNKDLKHMASGFGTRIDPVYHTPKFHAGMDFSAPTGTKIFATGKGTVTFAGWKQGYGNCVIIDHGFNYESLYAHLHEIQTHQGAKVQRGDIIGLVGSTGKSTGPHLHYEVHYKEAAVNPINYYFYDLSPEDYDKMLQMTTNSAQVFD